MSELEKKNPEPEETPREKPTNTESEETPTEESKGEKLTKLEERSPTEKIRPEADSSVQALSADDLFDDEEEEEGRLEQKEQGTRVDDLSPNTKWDYVKQGGRTTILLIKDLSKRVEILTWVMALIAAVCLGGKAFTAQYGDMIVFLIFTLISANVGFRLPDSRGLRMAKEGGKHIKTIYEKTFLPKD